jgi:uncharacterized protein (TIGR02594 family)
MAEPRWLQLARADLGLREKPGIANNPLIVQRLSSIPKLIGMVYNADSVPWCGAMLAWWMSQAGIKPPAIAARAKSWSTWGSNLRAEYASPGAVLCMDRQGGGHVTLYVGEDASHYYGLGANQGDSVSIAKFPKGRITAIRWPKGEPCPGVRKWIKTLADINVSNKES